MDAQYESEPWVELEAIIAAGDAEQADEYLARLPPGEPARAVVRLAEEDQDELIELLDEEDAATLLAELPESQAVDIMERLVPERVAAIMEETESADRADLIGSLPADQASAILDELPEETADEVRRLIEYPPDCAGGLMVTEYVSFQEQTPVERVLNDLRANAETYAGYDVQYVYVVASDGTLVGVLRLRDIVLSPPYTPIRDIMTSEPAHVDHDVKLADLRHTFERHPLFGLPVIDNRGRLVGVVRRADIERAVEQQAGRTLLKFAGILGGEELRTMPLPKRTARRLSWLTINIFLNVIAASVIAMYQDTLSAVIALAVFLPIISDMSGCSGSQAVAVSMRELSLGLIRRNELLRVLLKEAAVGVVNGIALGGLLGTVAYLWKGNAVLGLVVGTALALNTLLAVCLGGTIPLALKALNQDPALASGPILTTVTDMCGFFLVLSFASATLPWLIAA